MSYYSGGDLITHKKRVKHSNEISFVSILRPYYFFSRVLGFLPFSLTLKSNGDVHKPRVSAFDLLWFVTTITLHIYLIFAFFQKIDFPKDPNASYILFFGDSIFNLAGLIIGIISMLLDMYNRSKLVDILNGFTDFGKEASILYFP